MRNYIVFATNGGKIFVGYQYGYLLHSRALSTASRSVYTFIESIPLAPQSGISIITEMELLGWREATQQDLKITHDFIAGVSVFQLDNVVKKQAIALRRTYPIKLLDAIIAATALIHDLVLLTRNVKDFKSIPFLKVISPHDM